MPLPTDDFKPPPPPASEVIPLSTQLPKLGTWTQQLTSSHDPRMVQVTPVVGPAPPASTSLLTEHASAACMGVGVGSNAFGFSLEPFDFWVNTSDRKWLIPTNFIAALQKKKVPWAFEDSEETTSLLLDSLDCLFSLFWPRDSTPSNFFAQVLWSLHAVSSQHLHLFPLCRVFPHEHKLRSEWSLHFLQVSG